MKLFLFSFIVSMLVGFFVILSLGFKEQEGTRLNICQKYNITENDCSLLKR